MKRKFSLSLLFVLWAVLAYAAPPQRILSVSPNVTEILYGIGAFDRVVAVSDYCSYPAAASRLPHVGGWTNPNLEQVFSLRPDLVVMTEAQAPIFGYQMQQLGLRTLAVPSQTVQDAFSAISIIGNAVGMSAEAQRLSARTRATLERVRNRTKNLNRPSVLIAVDRSPGSLRDLYVATQGSFLAELVELAGGRVMAPPARAGYSNISKETLLAVNADIVIDLKPGSSAADVERARLDWREMRELNAVRNGRVFELQQDFMSHCSQRIAETVVLLAKIIHPEVPAREWGGE